jgi:Glycosyl hydrolases family 2
MTNRIVNVDLRVQRVDAASAEVWVLVEVERITPATEVCGRIVGPKLPTTSTVEVAYALLSFPKKPKDLPPLAMRVSIPEPNLWVEQTPFVYDGVIELWQDGERCDRRDVPGVRLVCKKTGGS